MRRHSALVRLISLFSLILLVVLGWARPAQAATKAPLAACTDPYVVQPGDTFYSIAQACGGSGMNYIMLININPQISDPDKLYPGELIRLTAEEPLPFVGQTGQPVQGGLQEGGVFIVRPGDSLAGIGYLYNTTVNELYRYNPQLWRQPRILPGDRIQLPPDARRSKGWVGVSSIQATSGDVIDIRVVDFPPYTDIDFVLRLYWEKIYGPGSGDPYDSMSYAVFADGKTDAVGEAHAALQMPSYSSLTVGKPWIVEVYTSESAQHVSALSAQIAICGRVYNWTTYQYELTCD